jgi:hypothetical protein
MPQAGLLELVAHGIQDIFLIGNPQITFFKTVYKRHTNFSMEAYQLSYDQTPTWGNRTTFKISHYADLMYTMILETDLPKLYAKSTSDPAYVGPTSDFNKGMGEISWVNNTGHALISYCDLTIGKQLIDRQYGEWMEIWTQLSQSESKKRGLDLMLNRNNTLEVVPGALTTYTPLQFWFCRNIGLALPLCALQYHDVQLEVNFRPFNQMYTFGANNYYSATSNGTSTLQVYKLYSNTPTLDTDLAKAKIVVFPDGIQYYIHPTTQISGGIQDGSLTNPYLLKMVSIIPAIYTKSTIYIKPNGVVDTSITGGSGQITESRLYVDYIYLDTIEQREFINSKHRYLIEQVQYSGSETITANAATKRFPILFNLPIKELFWILQLDSVFITNDLFNYSYTVDPIVPQNNIIASALININGIERFSIRTGNYFRLIQPYQKHTRSPNGFIYIYAFSVKPEDHQPSGCSNFSKIDTKELFLNINPNLGSTQLRVYGLSYNILRIMSGMGGVAFSS